MTEFDYNPAGPSAAESAAGFTDNNDFEFIELTNTGPVPLDLDGAAYRRHRLHVRTATAAR